jgi:regulation of enolase protein 1 (concanavalin A-like superfamily)
MGGGGGMAGAGGVGGMGGVGGIGGAPPAGIVSDDFSSGTLNTHLWTVVDPQMDGTAEVMNEALELLVPSGQAHDPWTPENTSLRVMQTAANEDFSIEVKFNSAPTVGQVNQIQGILVQQDLSNYIRFDAYSDGTTLSVFSAALIDDAPQQPVPVNEQVAITPLFLRLTRTGDQFTVEYSDDGSTYIEPTGSPFTQALTVSAVGVFAGNAGMDPAHTAVVDYFRNVTQTGP